MNKTIDFSIDEFWNVMDKHCSMMVAIEQRITELAQRSHGIDKRYVIHNVDFKYNRDRTYVYATFKNIDDSSCVAFLYDIEKIFSED